MWVSVHDTSNSWVALLWLIAFVKACFEKYDQCFSGGMMIISALLIKYKMDASQTFVKVSRYDIPSRLFLKNQGYNLRQQILMRCIASNSSENSQMLNPNPLSASLARRVFCPLDFVTNNWTCLHGRTVPSYILLHWQAAMLTNYWLID